MSTSTTRTAAALLFGGTLGLAGAADAGLTVTSASVYLSVIGGNAISYDLSVTSSGAFTGNAYASLSLSAFTSNGFWLNAQSDGTQDGIWTVFASTFAFTADTNTTVRLTGNISSEAATVFLVDTDTNSSMFLRASGDGAWDSGELQLLAGGHYLVGVNGPLTFANGGTETGTVINFAVVPAPGAAALIGLAGLVSRRRRA